MNPLAGRTCRVVSGQGVGIRARIVDGYATATPMRSDPHSVKTVYVLVLEVVSAPTGYPPDFVGAITMAIASDVHLDPPAGSDAPAEEMDAFTFHWKEAARRLAREMGARDLAEDANPGQVIDAAIAAGRNVVDAMRRFARIVVANAKHGPRGGGERGPCDPGCAKCHAERVLAEAAREECKPAVDHARGPVPPDHVIVALCRVCNGRRVYKGRTMLCTPDSQSRLAWVRACTAAGDLIDYVDSSKLGDYPACQCALKDG